MKRLFALLLVLALALAMAACGADNTASTAADENAEPDPTATEEADAAQNGEEAEEQAADNTADAAVQEETAAEAEEAAPAEEAVPAEETAEEIPFVGSYRNVGMIMDGTMVDYEALGIADTIGESHRVIINEDGTGIYIEEGKELSLTWDEEHMVINGKDAEYTFADGELRIPGKPGIVLIFRHE